MTPRRLSSKSALVDTGPERRDFILPQLIVAENGVVTLPDKPGLGVEIDWPALEPLRIDTGTTASGRQH